MQYISISFLIVIFFCADIIFAQKYDLPNQHNWRVGDSWVIEMDRYYNDWMAVRATVNPKDEEDRICQTLLLQVTVSGEKIFDNKKCWELDYKTNCLPDRDTSETDLGQNRSYVSKDDGSLVCYQNATVSFPVPIEIIVNGVPYAFIGELPVQTIPWKYDCPANNNEPDVSGYKIKIDHTITKDGLDFIVYLRRSSFGNTGKIEKIIQRWNKKSNWWNEYEYWQYGTTRYHKSFFARLVKYIPADGFCEWHNKNGKKIADAKFAKMDNGNVFLQRKINDAQDNAKIVIPLTDISKADQQQIEMIMFTNMPEKNVWRMWTYNARGGRLKAKYISSKNDTVTLQKEFYTTTIKLSDLSKEDQEYIERIRNKHD